MFCKNLPRPSRVLGNRWTAGFKIQCSPRRVFGNAYWVSSDDPGRGHPCLCHLDLEDPDSPNVKSTFSQNDVLVSSDAFHHPDQSGICRVTESYLFASKLIN